MAIGVRSLAFGFCCLIGGILISAILEFPYSHLNLSAVLKLSPIPSNHEIHSTTARLGNENENERVNATFVTLTRNSDLWDIARSIRSVEDRFNRKHGYDWVFLNDVAFSEEFKNVTSSLTSGSAYYGLVPKEHWSYPEWIDQKRARQARRQLAEEVMNGGSESYRHMCRYFSGFFFRHELLLKYDYYWRVEPEIELFCDVDFDPFRYMRDHGKKYGFVISMFELDATIPSLWRTVKSFAKSYPQHIASDNSLGFLSDDGGKTYNGCHFWSNFEVGSLNWLRSQEYLDYFDFLDRQGGFFYERWGDAPVHSIAAGLLLEKEEIHFFNEIGYYHPPFTHCPTGEPLKRKLKCHCDQRVNFDWMEWSCLPRFLDVNQLPYPSGYEEELPLIREEAEKLVEKSRINELQMLGKA